MHLSDTISSLKAARDWNIFETKIAENAVYDAGVTL